MTVILSHAVLKAFNFFRKIRVIQTVRKFLDIPLTPPFFSGRGSLLKNLWFPLLFLWPIPSLSLSHYMNEKHYPGPVSYQLIDYVEERSTEIKKTVKRLTGKSLDTKTLWDFFFVQTSEGLKIKGGKENRTRLVYVYLDQWRAHSGGYSSYFGGVHLTEEDLNKIKPLFSESELHIIDSLTFLWNSRYHPVQAFQDNLWDLSKIRESGHQEFEFLWAFLIVESQVFSYFLPGAVDPNSLPEMSNNPSPLFRKARGMIHKFAKKGFAPAQHLEAFMNMVFHRDLNTALEWFERSYRKGYRRDVCSAVLGILYRRLQPHRPDKAEHYLKEAIYTHDYGLPNYRTLKGELLELYTETGRLNEAFKMAREIVEKFTDFGIPAFLQSMEWLSWYFYNRDNRNLNSLSESYTWMEMARIAAEDYGGTRHLSRQPHSISLRLRLPLQQRRKLSLRAADLYEARKHLLTADSSRACDSSLFRH